MMGAQYKSDLVDMVVDISETTERAALVDYGAAHPVWLPLRLIEVSVNPGGKTYTLTLPEWLAVERGMI